MRRLLLARRRRRARDRVRRRGRRSRRRRRRPTASLRSGRSSLFVATLPLWVLLARVYGLYDRDEERTDHSTVDDVVGVVPGRDARNVELPRPHASRRAPVSEPRSPRHLLAPRGRSRAAPPCRRSARSGAARPRTSRTSSSSAPATSRACSPRRSRSIRSTGSTSSGSSTATTRDRGNGNGQALRSSERPTICRQLVREYGVAPRRDRLLHRLPRPDARRHPLDAGHRRPDRHRSAHVRGARNERPAPHDRGDSARRPPEPAALRVVAVPQAVARSRRGDARAGPPRSRLLRRRARDQARLARPGLLPPGADGRAATDVPRLQVPDDGRRRRGPEGRGRAPEHAQRRRRADVQGAGRPARDAGRAVPPALADRRAAAAPQRPLAARCPSSGRAR